MGRDNNISTWGLFGQSQFNVNNFTAVYIYLVENLAFMFLTVVILMEVC